MDFSETVHYFAINSSFSPVVLPWKVFSILSKEFYFGVFSTLGEYCKFIKSIINKLSQNEI